MISLREVVNEINRTPRPNRRRLEVLIKLTYLQGREDQSCLYNKSVKKYNELNTRYKKVRARNHDIEQLLPRRPRVKPLY